MATDPRLNPNNPNRPLLGRSELVLSLAILGLLIVFLVPLPFIMRRPRPNEQRQLAAH